MRNLLTLIFVILIFGCSGTKKVIKNTPEDLLKISKSKKNSVTKKAKKDSIIIQPQEKGGTIVNNSDFNQNLTKRTFTKKNFFWDELLEKHVSNDGKVNYKSFKTEHKKLLDYIYVLSSLYSDRNFKNLPRTEKLAYWINAYNAMTIDLILRHYPIKSIKDIKNPWDQRFWKLGDKWYNLNEIEHQILRKMNEPRIHFAIVCASYSCPKLLNEPFQASNLEEQLTQVTKSFLNDSERNNISKDNIQLSKIFQWFAKDFKQNGSLIDFLNRYTAISISAKAKKTFKDYNWDLNE